MLSSAHDCASAGGLLLRRAGSLDMVVVVERLTNVEPKWQPVLRQLPKGAVQPGEALIDTARREVLEETGISPEVLGFAGTAQWTYERAGTLFCETVYYFFMRPTTAELKAHDAEFDRVSWIPLEQASVTLSYPEERALVRRVLAQELTLQLKLDDLPS